MKPGFAGTLTTFYATCTGIANPSIGKSYLSWCIAKTFAALHTLEDWSTKRLWPGVPFLCRPIQRECGVTHHRSGPVNERRHEACDDSDWEFVHA